MERSSIQSKAYNCDCLEYMRSLPDNYFDLAIADPPYGIGASKPSKKAERARQADGSILQVPVTDFIKKDWDNNIPTQEFFDELRRVSKNQIIWGANYFGLQGGMIVWDKINGNSDQYDCEIAYQSFNKRTDLVHYMWNGMFQGKYCGRDIRQAAVQQGNKALNEKRIHPTQKPVILYEWLLNNYAKKGDRIFDPMMGSQSSRIAAYKLGFNYVGCELDKEYFEKGCIRFNSMFSNNNKAVGGGIQTASKDMTKLEEIALNAAKPHDYDPAEKQVFQNGYVKGANTMLEAVEEILDRNKQAYMYSKEYYVNIDVFKQRIDELKERKPAVSKEAPEKAFKDGYVKGVNAILDYFKEPLGRSEHAYRYNGVPYIKVDVFTQRINELKDKMPAISEETPEKALKPDNRFSDEMQEAKAKLFATILEAQKDLGDEISITPTEISENGDKHVITEILPDFESPFEDQNIIGGVSHSGDEDCVHNLALCLENVNDADALGKAVHEAHVKHLEQFAKQAIHDRIVTPSARVFTPEQVGVLNRYHQVATPDAPANETFSRLLHEVAQEPDVARKPEKWVTDTAKELDGLAEGITRDQVRGLHK